MFREIRSTVINVAESVSFERGKIIFNEGDSCDLFLIVESGKIKVFKSSEKGQELTLYKVDANNLCTLTTSCILSSSKYPARGMVEEDVSGYVLNKTQFDELMVSNAEFRKMVFSSMTSRFNSLVERIDEIAFHSIRDRLLRLLHESKDSDGEVRLTHQEIANELGVERESISRALRVLSHQEVIQLGRGRIKLGILE